MCRAERWMRPQRSSGNSHATAAAAADTARQPGCKRSRVKNGTCFFQTLPQKLLNLIAR